MDVDSNYISTTANEGGDNSAKSSNLSGYMESQSMETDAQQIPDTSMSGDCEMDTSMNTVSPSSNVHNSSHPGNDGYDEGDAGVASVNSSQLSMTGLMSPTTTTAHSMEESANRSEVASSTSLSNSPVVERSASVSSTPGNIVDSMGNEMKREHSRNVGNINTLANVAMHRDDNVNTSELMDIQTNEGESVSDRMESNQDLNQENLATLAAVSTGNLASMIKLRSSSVQDENQSTASSSSTSEITSTLLTLGNVTTSLPDTLNSPASISSSMTSINRALPTPTGARRVAQSPAVLSSEQMVRAETPSTQSITQKSKFPRLTAPETNEVDNNLPDSGVTSTTATSNETAKIALPDTVESDKATTNKTALPSTLPSAVSTMATSTTILNEAHLQSGRKCSTQQSSSIDNGDGDWHTVGIFQGLNTSVNSYIDNSVWSSANANLTSMDLPDLSDLPRINLEPGTAYRFRIRAINTVGASEWSEVTSFKTCLPGFPGAPSAIKISKSMEGAHLTWEPPTTCMDSNEIVEYSVYLAVKPNKEKDSKISQHQERPSTQLAFVRVYVGAANQCTVSQTSLGAAHVDCSNKPAIIFRIAARNEKGYGPATQVRWLQEPVPGSMSPASTALASLSGAGSLLSPTRIKPEMAGTSPNKRFKSNANRLMLPPSMDN